ncbi:MAG: RDD family protein [Armatimonadota bacterium]
MSEDLITVETPEHIQVQYELAGIGSRALAGLVDALAQGLIAAVVVGSLLWVGAKLHWQDAFGVAAAVAVGTAGFLAATAYYVVSEMLMDGQSPGKRLAGLRVIRDDGTPITFLDSAIRNIIRVVDMIPFFYTVGLIAVFSNNKSKRLGDMAVGTVVVKERMLELPAGPSDGLTVEAPAVMVSAEAEARLRNSLHLLSPADYEAADRFLQRRYELDPETRGRFSQQLVVALLAKLPLVSGADFPHTEALLETLLRLRRERPL